MCRPGPGGELSQFSVLNGTAASTTSSAPFDPCTSADVVDGIRVGTYTGNLAVLFPGTAAGIALINQQASGTGNDGAVDNVRLLDVTPQLNLSGTTGTTAVGAPANLTFTVTNTSELDAKNGWAFTANLPAGLALANGTVTTDCGAGSAVAGAAPGTIDVGGNLAAGQASCAVTVQVTSNFGGSYQLCAAQISNLVGVDPPGCTTLTFTGPVFDARADSVSVNTPVLSLGPLVNADYECKAAAGTANATVASANLGAVGNLGVLTTAASGAIGADGTRTAAASAVTTGVSLLGGLVTADALNTTARAQQPLTTSGPGTITLSGGAVFTNLKIAGVSIAANPGPNTTINLPLIGSIVLNQQTPIAGGAGITVNALNITLLTGTHVTLSTSTAALLSATATCPAS
ncbi:MAG TPA: choice-of-anchor P family protein [Actinocrinis sp.]|nr:choice-of-anchor P family protein [Actinocrinis sp.]